MNQLILLNRYQGNFTLYRNQATDYQSKSIGWFLYKYKIYLISINSEKSSSQWSSVFLMLNLSMCFVSGYARGGYFFNKIQRKDDF